MSQAEWLTDFRMVATQLFIFIFIHLLFKRSSHGVVTNVLDNDSVVSEFELQSCYYVHFRSTLKKG